MIPFQSGPPSIDVNNPFYCPAVPAASYIKSLHDQVRRKTGSRVQSRRYDRLVISFARVLENAVLTDAFDSSDDEKYDVTAGAGHRVVGNCGSPTSSSSSDEENPLSTIIPLWEREEDSWDQVYVASKKRKQDTFSDIRGPSKYAKSVLSAHDSSFDVSVKREALVYSDGPGSQAKVELAIQGETAALALRVRDLEERLFGPPIGTESARDIHAFIERLDSMLPGIRLKERLSQLFIISHQSIIDFLGYNGYLSSRVLATFRTSEVRWITLTESLTSAGGLNLCNDILPTFNQPNSFLFVSELSIRDIHIQDFDLTHIHHLPRLATLLLDNTSISNEAIFLLLPLKHTLTQLSLGSNPAINDDAVPALLLFSKLAFLCILDTGIGMPGLRRLACTIYDEGRIIDIEIPTACEVYVRELDKKYELNPRPPLIAVPEASMQLSMAALQRNLAAHKAKNPDILATGSKREMAERLKLILEMRRMDLVIRAMILGDVTSKEEEEVKGEV